MYNRGHFLCTPEHQLQDHANLEPENTSSLQLNVRMNKVVQDAVHRWQAINKSYKYNIKT